MALIYRSVNRTRRGGWVNPAKLPKGPHGRNLCRWCLKEVPKGRITFCSQRCVDEHLIRTSPAYMRRRVWERDRGICAICGVDTLTQDAPNHHNPERWLRRKRERGWRRTGHLWQADHILPVCEGGGECGLENLRTLCTVCHKEETRRLAARRAARKE